MLKKIHADFKNKRVLITGASGFLGSHLTKRLVEWGAVVSILARPSSGLERIAGCLDRVTLFKEGDLTNSSTLKQIIRPIRPQLIFHLAAEGVNPLHTDTTSLIQSNVLGTVNLIESLADIPYERLVYAGSCFEYGNSQTPLSEEGPLFPVNPYAASKTMAGHLLNLEYQKRAKPITFIRPFTFFGPHEPSYRLIPSIIRSIIEEKPIRITSGQQTRDYTYVEDMVDAFLLATHHKLAIGEIFNIGSGETHSVKEIAERVRAIMKSGVPIHAGSVKDRTFEASQLCANPAKARRILGWNPQVTFDEGILKTADWIREGVALS